MRSLTKFYRFILTIFIFTHGFYFSITESFLIRRGHSPNLSPSSKTCVNLWGLTAPPPPPPSLLPITDLPADFPDAVNRAVSCTIKGLAGKNKCRIEFDTSVSDQTYSSLHNSLPFLKLFTKTLADALDLSIYPAKEEVESVPAGGERQVKALRIFLPDMGAAAMLRTAWKLGTGEDELPINIFTSNILGDSVLDQDKCVIIACPLYSEADSVKRVLAECEERGLPCILINPKLVNPDQGYGVRAKTLVSDVIAATPLVYQLRTLSIGALVHEHGDGYTIWLQDETEETGYSFHRNYDTEPPNADIIEITREIEAKKKKEERNPLQSMAQGFGDFISQVKKL